MSAFANVYVGSAPNDLTGDTLRHAFEIINTNFANIEAGTANITVNAPVRTVAGRTGNVSLYVNDVMGAASLANVIAQTNAANVYANVLYATTTSNITANVYSQVEANLASNIATIAEGLITSGNLLDPVYANITTINANVTAANSAIATINSHLTGTDYQVTTLIAANIATQANLGTATNSISALISNSATQSTQIDTLTANSVTQHGQIRTIDANLGVATVNIINLQANSAQQETTLITLSGNAALQDIRLVALESNAATQGGQVRTLDANLGTLSTTYIALTANAAVQTVELAALISNSATQGSQIRTLDANIGNVVTTVAGMANDISDLESSIGEIGPLTSNAATQATQIRTIDANLGAVSTNVALQFTSINTLRANITAANAAIVTANSAVVAYTDDLHASQQANINLVSMALATTNANLGVATINVANLQANAVTQATEIISLRANITAANASTAVSFTSTDTEIGKLRANITAANTAIITANTGLKSYVDDRITATAYGNTQVASYLPVFTGNVGGNVITANIFKGDGSQLSNMFGNTQVFAFLQTYTPQQVGNITANGIALFDSENLAANIITMFNDGNINAGNVILRNNFYGTSANIDQIYVGNIEITNNISFAGNVTGNAVGTTSTYDLYYVNSGGGIYSDGYFFANGDPFVAPAITGNITFSDTTISTDTGAGIILNSAGAGEIAMQDYVGINNLNPGYWLHIGDGSPGAVQNTGNVSIDFNNGTDAAKGSTILDYAWWENSNGNDNRGTGDHIHVGLYKNDDSHDNPFIEFDYTTGNATIGNITAEQVTTTNGFFWSNGTAYATSGGSYGNIEVSAYLEHVSGNIIPDTDIAYNLGSATNRFKDLFLSNSTIYLGNAVISASETGTVTIPGLRTTDLGVVAVGPVYEQVTVDNDNRYRVERDYWKTHQGVHGPYTIEPEVIQTNESFYADPAAIAAGVRTPVYRVLLDDAGYAKDIVIVDPGRFVNNESFGFVQDGLVTRPAGNEPTGVVARLNPGYSGNAISTGTYTGTWEGQSYSFNYTGVEPAEGIAISGINTTCGVFDTWKLSSSNDGYMLKNPSNEFILVDSVVADPDAYFDAPFIFDRAVQFDFELFWAAEVRQLSASDGVSANTVTTGDLVVTGNAIISGNLTVSPTTIFMGNLAMSAPNDVLVVNTGIEFTMGNPSDWDTAPTTIAAALDELAARLRFANI